MSTICRINRNASPLDRVIDDLFNEPFFLSTPARFVASGAEHGILALDFTEDDTGYTVRADVPGFTKDQVEVSAHDGALTIRAVREEQREEKNEHYHRRERRSMNLGRSVALPGDVIEDQTTAELKDGVLTVRLMKSPKSTPRKIAVN